MVLLVFKFLSFSSKAEVKAVSLVSYVSIYLVWSYIYCYMSFINLLRFSLLTAFEVLLSDEPYYNLSLKVVINAIIS